MDPFNIVVVRAGKQLGLNIHPKNQSEYMVLFEGSLVGEVLLNEQGKVLGAVSASELLEGDYPDYPCDVSLDCEGLISENIMVDQIGREISRALGLLR
ncbi:hypothetical protein [Pedobacter aquatilis]|uniref:hypothetical protein n=1 Tax=Pedobacter aquatilis TaxID=351343 RepID=UPI001203202F|nr:hypothetical protein [Pedobacter aquatilis]RZK70403.1 MAG: hypothetical protein EOO85_21120 [Pedobacter sp.]